MKAKSKYSDEPLGDIEIVEDFLPSPDQLAFRDDSVKITISLSKASVEFFKEKAEEFNTPYQKMIRRLLDSYAERYGRPAASGSKRARRPHERA